jgi:Lrp/AsnC family leucine-responsive transcriptional regulator
MPLDRLDARILRLVQRNNRATTDEIGASVGLSATAVQRRLKRLRSIGVIEGDVAIVNPRAVGRPVTMLVLVSLERERADIIDNFKRAIRSTAEVMTGYYVTGEADFVLVVTSKDMEDYERFTRQFFYENPDIKNFKTLVVMDRVKSGFAIPIDTDDPATRLEAVTPDRQSRSDSNTL